MRNLKPGLLTSPSSYRSILGLILLVSLFSFPFSLQASQAIKNLPPIARELEAFVTGTEVDPGPGVPMTWLRLWVKKNIKGGGESWLKIRIPGAHIKGRMVRAAGFGMPVRGDWVRIRLRTKNDSGWLISSPEDLRILPKTSWFTGK